ncbi:MAG: hypothetical protein J6C38_07860 [Oscillospiraceae bacterium]|nr:hypothetical protein [Oscillospiraceae bacterium]
MSLSEISCISVKIAEAALDILDVCVHFLANFRDSVCRCRGVFGKFFDIRRGCHITDTLFGHDIGNACADEENKKSHRHKRNQADTNQQISAFCT